MIKGLPPPTEAEEYRNTAEILRDLAARTLFVKTRSELFICADNLDRMAALADHQPEAMVQPVLKSPLGSRGERIPPTERCDIE